VGGAHSRAAWIIADQAIASAANAGLTITLSRTVSPEEFGAFALAFSIYSLTLSLAQGVSGQVVVVRYSREPRAKQVLASAVAGGTAIILAALCSAVVLLTALLLTAAPLRSVFLVLAVLLPALVLQDTWRTVFVARGEPSQAFFNDLAWITMQVVGIGVLLALRVEEASLYVCAWGVGALIAAVIGCRQNGGVPTFRSTPSWLRDHREVGVPSVVSALAVLGTTQVAFVLIAAVGRVEDVGGLRAAQTLLGPLNIVAFAMSSFAVPEIVRRKPNRSGLVRIALIMSVFLVTMDVLWGTVLLLLPDSAGQAVLGATWSNARSALPGMVAFTCLIGATAGASAVLRALNRADFNLWITVLLGPLILVFSVAGVRLDGSAGAALGFALAAAVVAPFCWLLLLRGARLGTRVPPVDVAVTESLPTSEVESVLPRHAP